MTDSWLLARGATIPQSADASSSLGDDIIPATVDIEKSNPTNQCLSDAKSNSTRKKLKGVLHFALNRLKTENISSFVKQRDKILTFPEKLMLLLAYVERTSATKDKDDRNESIGWSPDGKVIVIRDIEHLTKTWLPLFLGDAKFSSFTRKLYRWGFRKTYPPSPQQENEAAIYFASVNFQKDDIALLSEMSSTTADKQRVRIARCSAASCSDIQDNHDAPQKALGSSPVVHRSSSPDGSQQSNTQQGFLWSSNDKAGANMSYFQSLIGNDVDRGFRHQESAARLERLVSAPGPTLLQHTHQTFIDHSSSPRAVADFVDRPSVSHLQQALQFSALSPVILGNGPNSEPAELLRLSNSQQPDHVQSTELNNSQLVQDLQNYNSALVDTSVKAFSLIMEGLIPSIIRQEIPHMSSVARLLTSEQSAEQALLQNLNSLLGSSWPGPTTSTSSSSQQQPMAALAMSNMSVASSPVLSNHSILASLLQQHQQYQQQQQQQQQQYQQQQQQRRQQVESNQRLMNPQFNLDFQSSSSRTVQSLLSEQKQLDMLAEWIRGNQGHFT